MDSGIIRFFLYGRPLPCTKSASVTVGMSVLAWKRDVMLKTRREDETDVKSRRTKRKKSNTYVCAAHDSFFAFPEEGNGKQTNKHKNKRG